MKAETKKGFKAKEAQREHTNVVCVYVCVCVCKRERVIERVKR